LNLHRILLVANTATVWIGPPDKPNGTNFLSPDQAPARSVQYLLIPSRNERIASVIVDLFAIFHGRLASRVIRRDPHGTIGFMLDVLGKKIGGRFGGATLDVLANNRRVAPTADFRLT
jgi:hypothetical protein